MKKSNSNLRDKTLPCHILFCYLYKIFSRLVNLLVIINISLVAAKHKPVQRIILDFDWKDMAVSLHNAWEFLFHKRKCEAAGRQQKFTTESRNKSIFAAILNRIWIVQYFSLKQITSKIPYKNHGILGRWQLFPLLKYEELLQL